MPVMNTLGALTAGVAAVIYAAATLAQFPQRPIKLVIPFNAGSPPDIVGRVTVQKMAEGLGQVFVVENRPGAAGTIAADGVAKSGADGYTILLGTTGSIASAPNLYPNVGFDPLKSFAPISRVSNSVFLVFVHSSVPASSLQDLIQLAKAKPGALAFGSGGNGNPLHIAGEMFKQAAGVDLLHVPYSKSEPFTDFAAGRTQVMFEQLPALVAHVRAGKIRPLAVAGTKRLPQLPDVPTSAEAGLPGYDVSVWTGLLAPAGTPAGIVSLLSAKAQAALGSKEVQDAFANRGTEPAATSPDEFAAIIRDDVAKWSRAIRLSGAKLD